MKHVCLCEGFKHADRLLPFFQQMWNPHLVPGSGVVTESKHTRILAFMDITSVWEELLKK